MATFYPCFYKVDLVTSRDMTLRTQLIVMFPDLTNDSGLVSTIMKLQEKKKNV
jgi:hypothetical protein